MVKEYSGFSGPINVRPMARLHQTTNKRFIWWNVQDWSKRYSFDIKPVYYIDREGLYSINPNFAKTIVKWCEKNLKGSYWVVFNENTYTPIPVTIHFSRKTDLVKFKIAWYDCIV